MNPSFERNKCLKAALMREAMLRYTYNDDDDDDNNNNNNDRKSV